MSENNSAYRCGSGYSRTHHYSSRDLRDMLSAWIIVYFLSRERIGGGDEEVFEGNNFGLEQCGQLFADGYQPEPGIDRGRHVARLTQSVVTRHDCS